ncbi:MAG: 50S ribosomal protein L18 [Candidatus Omnitrophica bacterium]|nr:50S ribosomal protein L18 [Candidatus Omnitrophota bacterium]
MDKIKCKKRRQRSIRKKLTGTGERPRLSVYKSNRSIYVQIINDLEGRTILGMSTLSPSIKGKFDSLSRKNQNFAEALGEAVAKAAKDKGIDKICFDRGGNLYHGVVKTLADAARKGGLEF